MAQSTTPFSDKSIYTGSNDASRFNTPVQYIKGVGQRLAALFGKLGVFTVRDLLFYLPRRYEDRSQFARINRLEHGEQYLVLGEIIAVDNVQTRGKMVLTKVMIDDGGGVLTLTWFNQKWLKDKFLKLLRKKIVVYGTAQIGRWGVEMNTPEWEIYSENDETISFGRVVPIYSLTEGLMQLNVRKAVKTALDEYLCDVIDILPNDIKNRIDLVDMQFALMNIHFPESMQAMEAARKRLVFDELFLLQLALAIRKKGIEKPGNGIAFTIPDNFENELNQMLPFELTNAQKRVIGEIAKDMNKPICMNRLVQGDVGSGKTVVALAAMLIAVRNGYQAALMAPTEILAEQHYLGISEMAGLLGGLGLSVDLLTGSLKAKQARDVRDRISSGQTHIIIGTHALIQESVDFHKLGLIIVDEQHRFGVLQRAALMEKGIYPDMLAMTATPIPRTLTLTVYGDLDISIINEMPPGRKPVKTHWKQIGEREKVYKALRKILEQGKQAYVICPLIEESEKLQVSAASELAVYLSTKMFPDMNVGLLHSQLKNDEKEKVITDFRNGKINVLVSTTVVEVGVDVKNATCIVIEDADRFGLAQLHQLRGRVGRGSDQSYCVLICEANTDEAIKRMQVMSSTNDGFVIAEEDLKIRGPGEFYGTKQSGLPGLKIADIFKDVPILEIARKEAFELVLNNPDIKGDEYKLLKKELLSKFESFQLAVVS